MDYETVNIRQTFNILRVLLGVAIVAAGIWGAFLLEYVAPEYELGAALAVMFTITFGGAMTAAGLSTVFDR